MSHDMPQPPRRYEQQLLQLQHNHYTTSEGRLGGRPVRASIAALCRDTAKVAMSNCNMQRESNNRSSS
jgi:hypothetical protein